MSRPLPAKALFASPWLYAGWAICSAALLLVTSHIDPHIFALAAFAAAFVSGLLALGAAILSWRRLPWALLAAVPAAVAFAELSTYKWA